MATAAQQVFAITELLEQILYDVPGADLYHLQRVNCKFRAVIESNSHCQRAMFLAPVPGGTFKPVSAPIHSNPKRVRWVPTSCPQASDHDHSRGGESPTRPRPYPSSRYFQEPKMNPILQKHFPSWSFYPNGAIVGLERNFLHDERVMHPEAAWKKMLLMQPPCATVNIRDWRCMAKTAHNPTGVTMGDVVDAVLGLDLTGSCTTL